MSFWKISSKNFLMNLVKSEKYYIYPILKNQKGYNRTAFIFLQHMTESLSVYAYPEKHWYVTHLISLFNNNTNYLQFLNTYHQLILLNLKSYRGFRLLFSLPTNGQRTWSNANTAKKNTSMLLNLKVKKLNKFTYHKYTKTEVLAEYINFLWSCQWEHEWKTMKRNWMYHRNFRKRPLQCIKFDEIINFRMEHFSTKVMALKKFKSHRKKIKSNKNNICGGFKFGFVYYYSKIFVPSKKCFLIYL